jgi:hypothetical protein
MMSDHKGTYLNYVKAVMPQRDHKDEDGDLIASHEYYKKLREGTLVFAKVSMSFYTFKDRNPKFLGSKVSLENIISEPWFFIAFRLIMSTLRN